MPDQTAPQGPDRQRVERAAAAACAAPDPLAGAAGAAAFAPDALLEDPVGTPPHRDPAPVLALHQA